MYATWRKLDMLIFIENLQWISQEISFSSTFQPKAICSLGICSCYNQLCSGYTITFQWKVHHCLTWMGCKEPETCCLSGKITGRYWPEVMPLASLTKSSGHVRASSPLLWLLLQSSLLRQAFVYVIYPVFYILCCLVAENVSPTYLYSCKSLEDGLSINAWQFV